MGPVVAQMINDATTMIERDLAAGYKLATDDARIYIDPPQGLTANYRGTTRQGTVYAGFYVPRVGMRCRFQLVVMFDKGNRSAPIYVVQDGEFYRVVDPYAVSDFQLVGVDAATTDAIALEIRKMR